MVGVVQLAEHGIVVPGVVGSSPITHPILSLLLMVDIAQLVSASDCGSEGRGFESHYPPHKKQGYPIVYPCFLWIMGFEKGGRAKRGKKVSGGHFFSPGENPWNAGCGSEGP